MKCFVTGGLGFIGSHLVDRLLAEGHEVVVFDNFTFTATNALSKATVDSPNLRVRAGDIVTNIDALVSAMAGCYMVYHLAANADVRYGVEYTRRDLEQNTIGTYNVLEAMRANGIIRIAFTSTGSIYGEAATIPTPEDAPFPVQTSLYGASKLAAEGLIQAYCAAFGYTAYIFRLVGVIGERYSHGHVIDFYQQLLDHPDRLDVLGNGQARKSYVYVGDVVKAILLGVSSSLEAVNIFNVGTDWVISVRDAAAVVAECMQLNPKITFGTDLRGWVGDNPVIHLDCRRIRRLGWFPTLNYLSMVSRTIEDLREHAVSG